MRRLGVIVALGALLGMFAGLLTASPALARGPKWQLLKMEPLTLPAALCGFKVRVAPQVNKEFQKELKAADGSMIVLSTGALRLSYTNLSTGKAITETTSGPAKFIVHPDGSLAFLSKGHQAFVLKPADAQRFGLPTVAVTAGGLTGTVAADGTLTSLSLHGNVLVNVCTALS